MTTINHTHPLNTLKGLGQNTSEILPYSSLTDDELLIEIYNSSHTPLMLELASRFELLI